MPTRTIDTKIAISGEKQYKQALSEINGGLKVLGSEMEKIDAKYKGNENSVQALTEKGDVLQRQLLSQKEKVDELRKALEYAKNEYGESNKKTMDYEASLNKAEAQAYKLEAAIKENDEALKNANETTGKNSKSVLDLADKFGINLPSGARSALEAIEGMSSGSVAAIGLVTGAVTAATKAVKELVESTKEAAGRVDDFVTASAKSGIDTYTLQVLNYMEDLADVDVSDVTSSITKLTASMASAAEGTESTSQAFANLGISVTNSDGTLRNASEVIWEVVDALGQVPAGTERDAAAMDIFGKKAQELNTLINLGSDGFIEFAQEAESVGYILDEQEQTTLNSYNDALDRTAKLQDALNQQMAVQLAPGLQELTEGWAKLKAEGIQLIVDSDIIETLGEIFKLLGMVAEAVSYVVDGVNVLLNPLDALQKLFGKNNETIAENNETMGVNNALVQANTNATESETAALQRKNAAMQQNTQTMQQLTKAQEEYLRTVGITASNIGTIDGNYVQAIQGRDGTVHYYNIDTADYSWADKFDWNASGNMNYAGGYTWVGENGPEKVYLPQGTQIQNAQESRNGGDTYNISINANEIKEFEDIVRIVKNSRVKARMRG